MICTPDISIGGQFVDILTKELASHPFQAIAEKLGMDNTYFPAWEGVLESQQNPKN